jgi:hypothetical protein
MGRVILYILIVFLTLALPSITYARSFRSSSSDVYVHGYYRKNGTYVQPHYRSAPDGIISNNYSCIDDGKCGLSGASSYVPVFIPTPTPIIIPDNPITKGSGIFNQMSRKPYYIVHARWFAIGDREYSIALSKYAGSDPGPNTDTTTSEFIFNNVEPGKWYINLKSKVENQWSKVTYFTVDIPPWTLPTPILTLTPTSIPSPTVEINEKHRRGVLSMTSNKSELNLWKRMKLMIYYLFR